MDTPIYILNEGHKQEDTHPSPYQHYLFAKYINEELNLGIIELESQKVKDYVKLYQEFYTDKTFFENLDPELNNLKNTKYRDYFSSIYVKQYVFNQNRKFIKSKLGYYYHNNEFQLTKKWLGQ